MSWKVILSSHAVKDAKRLKEAGLKSKAERMLRLLEDDPFVPNPPYEKLIGNLSGSYSRRINIKHRLVYDVDEEKKTVHILRMWTHYE